MKKLIIYFLSIISIIRIFFINNQKKNKKIILFYFPIKIYQKNLIDLIINLKENYKVILIYNLNSKQQIEKIKDSYFFDFFYAKFIPFHKIFLSKINFFISSYISYVYPPNSKNIYISHDIYDAPMINQKLERNLILRMSTLDYIFASSELSKKYLESKIKKVHKKSYTKIINTGYLKLDHLIKKIKQNKKGNSILIAPGYSLNYKDHNIYEYLEKIIINILDNTKKKIIFRPHPLDLTKKGNPLLINGLIKKFNKYKNFSCNLTPSYINEFNKSEILITDLTSTAYTFAFSTLKPVIFFSKSEALLQKSNDSKLKFFLDRKKVGSIINKVDRIIPEINYLLKNKNIYKNKIRKLRKKRIEYFNISSKKTLNTLDNIFKH